MKFTVEMPPVGVNEAYRRRPQRGGPEFYKTDAARDFQQRIQWTAAAEDEPALQGPVEVELWFYWPTDAGDIDAPVKLVLDALQRWAYGNDSQVTDAHLHRRTDRERPRVEVEVKPAVAAQTPADFRAVLGPKPLKKLNRRRLKSSVRRFAEGQAAVDRAAAEELRGKRE